ncbi:MAG: hypothetical protein HUK26_07965, partial [Duodenibacillus sp.]|nr:hypothetical protein [Oscillospiraceae bacterium]MCF0254250.1 hypothetical protein [Duodenibacillus sp.]
WQEALAAAGEGAPPAAPPRSGWPAWLARGISRLQAPGQEPARSPEARDALLAAALSAIGDAEADAGLICGALEQRLASWARIAWAVTGAASAAGVVQALLGGGALQALFAAAAALSPALALAAQGLAGDAKRRGKRAARCAQKVLAGRDALLAAHDAQERGEILRAASRAIADA